ncbi:Gfo/Idh/MocA family oxidoreductase [Metabacillus sp. GX 13764]|uniref:Gfo/Idh/MocA family protein n=1 Tax=Metabacillus kandeliae TaxID=2900151 RepID=UPI001E633921|nr:Gfo/Idh/MocA family oxidoreductase [Metabacillus kandeliae]MCD7035583.1 Gfo/Idh/MocA family oxidoreductase [Metabacillus kandeliae]
MKKLRIGVIGVGGIATGRHIPAFQQFTDQAEITAVSDVNVHRAEDVAKQFQIPLFFSDYKEMFEEIDAVIICTPNKFHAEITVDALEAAVHVLCEKPMALTASECERMAAAQKDSGKKLAIGYHYRFMKESQAAKKVMLTDEIGTPLVIRAKGLRRRKVPGWGVFTNKELQGGGSLIDYGCHLIDLALWLIGNPKHTEVSGSSYNALSKIPNQVNLWGDYDHQKFNVDDHVTAYMKFENGASLLFETSWATNIRDDEEHLSISGVNGGINVFPFELYTTRYNMLFNSAPIWIPGEEDPGILQAKNFINACLGEEELIVKPEEAMQVSQIIDAIYKSSDKVTVVE